MSINTAHASNGVLIFLVERILIYYDGVEIEFEGPPDVPQFKGKKRGRLYLTTHRVIFNNKDMRDSMQSFSLPFRSMRDVELEQPIFGANYIKGRVVAEPDGNWTGEAKFKMYFTHGGAIEFGQAMLRAASLASRNRPEQPPPYGPPAYGNYYPAPPPAYAPPSDPYYAWVPYQTFPTAPPENTVYVMEAPPPYPGIVPDTAPYPPTSNAHDAKAKEAAASAYYNPAYPHNMYASAPPLPAGFGGPPNSAHEPPPSYDQASKKTD